uniref:RNase H type-1 domain-containing protein n=1 Tax=Rhizophagus irregularis (strain DAOM 181602 / DAOM 197198 / MUCL 43194) TaxID=747089 RepID=U9UTN8_RHIID
MFCLQISPYYQIQIVPSNSSRKFLNINLDPSSFYFIENILLGHPDTISQLIKLAENFENKINFIFYTDGSYSKYDRELHPTTQMGFAWVETSDYNMTTSDPPISFTGALSFNPLSTKAEIYALLAAIIVVPHSKCYTYFSQSHQQIDVHPTTPEMQQ